MLAVERQGRSVVARLRNTRVARARDRGLFPPIFLESHRWPVKAPVLQDPRVALDELIRETRTDYTAISRMIRRNPSYIQQYIKRGTPKRLEEQDRRVISAFFGVPETILGASLDDDAHKPFRKVPRLDVRASAGLGTVASLELLSETFGFSERWLRDLAQGNPDGLSLIKVKGDSMETTLSDGDDIMVNRNDGAARLRDGIYVLRLEDDLLVKRVARGPVRNRITIKSDNPAYPTWTDVDVSTVSIIGRVVWFSRRM